MTTTRPIAAPATLPLTTAEICDHLRMEVGQDDTKILAALGAATAHIEETYGVVMVTQTLATVYLDWSAVFHLPRGPVSAVSSVKYTPRGEAQLTMPSTDYAVGLNSRPVMIAPAIGKNWPSVVLEHVDAVEITYVAGFGDVAAVPAQVKQAVGLLTHALYFDRGGGGADAKTLNAIRHLLGNRRLW